MNISTKTIFLVLSLSIFQQIQSIEQRSHRSLNSKFPPYSTQNFLYTKTNSQSPDQQNTSTEPTIISDITSTSTFTTAIVRELITQEVKDGIATTTIETWTSQNPSYLTWNSAALIAAGVSIIALNTLFTMHESLILSSDNFLTYLVTNEKHRTKMLEIMIEKGLISEKDVTDIIINLAKKSLVDELKNKPHFLENLHNIIKNH